MAQHLSQPGSVIATYEDMRRAPETVLRQIVDGAGWNIRDARIAEAVDFAGFDKLRQAEVANTFNTNRLKPGDPGDPESYKVRRAKVEGYKDYFNAAEQAQLLDYLRQHLDPRTGYISPQTFN